LSLLWKRSQSFYERKLLVNNKHAADSMRWSNLDVEGVCCMGRDVYIAASDRFLYFQELKMVKTHELPEEEKIKFFYVSENLVLLVLNSANRFRLLKRRGLEVVRKWR